MTMTMAMAMARAMTITITIVFNDIILQSREVMLVIATKKTETQAILFMEGQCYNIVQFLRKVCSEYMSFPEQPCVSISWFQIGSECDNVFT